MDHFFRFTPCLWFDDDAEDAVALYTSAFANSRVLRVVPSPAADGGAIASIEFELDGQPFVAINGRPVDAGGGAPIVVHCRDVAELDHYRETLGRGAPPPGVDDAVVRDRFGTAWRTVLMEAPVR